jgi:hypothetical protein
MTVAELRELLGTFAQDAEVKVLVPCVFGPELVGNYGRFHPDRHIRPLDCGNEKTDPECASSVYIGG